MSLVITFEFYSSFYYQHHLRNKYKINLLNLQVNKLSTKLIASGPCRDHQNHLAMKEKYFNPS